MTRALRRRILAALAASLPACAPARNAPDGQGLVLLPWDGPLARGVAARDPRPTFHDFGRVSDGDTVARVFQLRNSDPRPVRITRVDPGCGCTVASLRVVHADGSVERGLPITSREPSLLTVPPGDLAEVEVRIETASMATKNADKLITVRILTDSPNGYFLTLEVHILVEQPFTVVPGTLALGRVPEGGGGEARVEIVQAPGFFHELGGLEAAPAGLALELVPEQRLGRSLWTLRARLEPPLARGPRSGVLRIATRDGAGEPGRALEVPFSATVVGDLATEPERLVFAAPRDRPAESSVELRSLLAGQRLRVTSVSLPEGQRALLAAELEPLDPDDEGSSPSWRVTLRTKPPLPEEPMLSGELELGLADPQHPTHSLEYVVHLR